MIEELAKNLLLSDGNCWIWTGNISSYGYGRFGKPKKLVHRIMWEIFRGPIPSGLEIDHLCRVKPCCNPLHLEPVTHAENNRRVPRSKRTHCPVGHEYSPDNTRLYLGHQYCRKCHRDRMKLVRSKA